MTIEFAPATRAATKARIALAGPSGSGKTYTSLAIGTRLGRTALIDTERGSASKYAGVNGWLFDTLAPSSFSPASLVEALAAAATAGYDVVVVDSLSHYWMGVDGMLEQVDRAAQRAARGNQFGGWKEMRPDERRMIDALVAYPGHVITTLRVKTEYIVEENEKGKKVPRKIGMKPEQREGIEYEFDVVGDLDLDNVLRVSKSRIPSLTHAVIERPGPELADTLTEWLSEGDDMPTAADYREEADQARDVDELKALFDTVTRRGLAGSPMQAADGTATTLGDYIRRLATEIARAAWQAEQDEKDER